MLLTIDIGNTHTVIGLFKGDEFFQSWRLQSNSCRTVDEFALQVMSLFNHASVTFSDISFPIICSVVPELTRVFSKLVVKYIKKEPVLFDPADCGYIDIRVDEPSSVGADRIANAIAARAINKAASIVIDFGTATTFDLVSEDGAYEGGVIAPGILISAQALFEKTAKLPHIQLISPESIVGKNTRDSMRSGIVLGYASLVDGVVKRIRAENYENAKVIATGGFAFMLSAESSEVNNVIPDLTLRGLLEIAKYNGYLK